MLSNFNFSCFGKQYIVVWEFLSNTARGTVLYFTNITFINLSLSA